MIWEGDGCWVDDHEDTAGVIRFLPDGVVGVFCDVECPYPRSWLAGNQDRLYLGMPPDLRAVAEEVVRTHPHMLLPLGDREVPMASAVLWSEGDALKSAVPEAEFMDNCGHILGPHLSPPEQAMAAWASTFALTAEEREFVQRVFDRKRAAGWGPIELSVGETQWLDAQTRAAERHGPYGHNLLELGISFAHAARQ